MILFSSPTLCICNDLIIDPPPPPISHVSKSRQSVTFFTSISSSLPGLSSTTLYLSDPQHYYNIRVQMVFILYYCMPFLVLLDDDELLSN